MKALEDLIRDPHGLCLAAIMPSRPGRKKKRLKGFSTNEHHRGHGKGRDSGLEKAVIRVSCFVKTSEFAPAQRAPRAARQANPCLVIREKP